MCVIELIVIGISVKKCITNKEPLTMKNLGKIVRQSMVSTATSTLGGIHFISDSISDGCLNGEAWLRKKFDGLDPEEIVKEYKFNQLLESVKKLNENIKGVFVNINSSSTNEILGDKTIKISVTLKWINSLYGKF